MWVSLHNTSHEKSLGSTSRGSPPAANASSASPTFTYTTSMVLKQIRACSGVCGNTSLLIWFCTFIRTQYEAWIPAFAFICKETVSQSSHKSSNWSGSDRMDPPTQCGFRTQHSRSVVMQATHVVSQFALVVTPSSSSIVSLPDASCSSHVI
jgi:hypothetical protein